MKNLIFHSLEYISSSDWLGLVFKKTIITLLVEMDVPEGNIRAKNITAENLNIELGGELEPHQQVTPGGLVAPGTTPKLKIYNQATLPQKIQYWLLVALSIGFLIFYGAKVLSSIGFLTQQCNCTIVNAVLPK